MARRPLTVDTASTTADSRITVDTALVGDALPATGGASDILFRLKGLLPAGWFSGSAPVREAVLGGLADCFAWINGFVAYARGQTRIVTSTGLWLDLTAYDFFGIRFLRRKDEADDSFRPRILKELVRPRNTRAAIRQAVEDTVGTPPKLFEPWNTGDCGAYGIGTIAYAGERLAEPVTGYNAPLGGYGVGEIAYLTPSGTYGSSPGAGCYGSLEYPNQIFVAVTRGIGTVQDAQGNGGYGLGGELAYSGGLPVPENVGGYSSSLGGYGIGAVAYIVPKPLTYAVGAGFWGSTETGASITDAEIYARIAETTAAGVTAWVAIDVAA